MGRGRRRGRSPVGGLGSVSLEAMALFAAKAVALGGSWRAEEVAEGVFFVAPEKAFGADEETLDRERLWDSFLFAVKGRSAVPEAAWTAAEETQDFNDYLTDLAVMPDGSLRLRSSEISQAWDRVVTEAREIHRVWLVGDDQSGETHLVPLVWSSPKVAAGLARVDHETARFLAGEGAELAAKVTNRGVFGSFAARFEEQRLMTAVPAGPRSRHSALAG